MKRIVLYEKNMKGGENCEYNRLNSFIAGHQTDVNLGYVDSCNVSYVHRSDLILCN